MHNSESAIIMRSEHQPDLRGRDNSGMITSSSGALRIVLEKNKAMGAPSTVYGFAPTYGRYQCR